jgi:hypothetical protein
VCVCGRQRRAGTKQSDLLLYLVPIAVGVAPLLGLGSSQFVDALRSAPLGRAAAPPHVLSGAPLLGRQQRRHRRRAAYRPPPAGPAGVQLRADYYYYARTACLPACLPACVNGLLLHYHRARGRDRRGEGGRSNQHAKHVLFPDCGSL